MSLDKSGKSILKSGDGELVFDLKAANASMRSVYINSGTYRVASTSAKPNIKVAVNTGAKEGAGAVFDNCLPELTLGGLYIGSLSSSWLNIGRVNLNGTTLNIGNAGNSTSTNLLPMPVFADGGTLNIQNERRMYLEGLPIGGTLAVDRADAQVVSRRTAVRWLFEDADNPLKDVVGSGERVLAPAGMPEVVTDPVRGKVLSISGGKYLKGPDADAGFAELQPQPTNNPYTVAFWLKPDAACDNLGKIFYWGLNTNGKSAALRLNNSAENGLMFTVWGDNRTFATAASPRDGNWHHFAVTYNGLKTFRIYYDGVQVDSFSNNAYYPPNQNGPAGRFSDRLLRASGGGCRKAVCRRIGGDDRRRLRGGEERGRSGVREREREPGAAFGQRARGRRDASGRGNDVDGGHGGNGRRRPVQGQDRRGGHDAREGRRGLRAGAFRSGGGRHKRDGERGDAHASPSAGPERPCRLVSVRREAGSGVRRRPGASGRIPGRCRCTLDGCGRRFRRIAPFSRRYVSPHFVRVHAAFVPARQCAVHHIGVDPSDGGGMPGDGADLLLGGELHSTALDATVQLDLKH